MIVSMWLSLNDFIPKYNLGTRQSLTAASKTKPLNSRYKARSLIPHYQVQPLISHNHAQLPTPRYQAPAW